MNKISIAIFILVYVLASCEGKSQVASSSSKNSETRVEIPDEIIVENGVITSAYGYNISIYGEYYIDELPEEIDEITIDHIMCIAVENCNSEMLKELIKKGGNPNSICDVDHILTEASFCEELAVEITRILIESGANINGSDEENNSFLSYAIGQNNIELVNYILRNGGNFKQQMIEESIGCFPMHSIETVQMFELLRSEIEKVGFSLRCRNGRTLLHQAIRNNHFELSKYLILNKVIDLSIEDNSGETVLDYAIKFNREEIIEILKSH